MKIESNQLLKDLKVLTKSHIAYVESIQNLDSLKLQQRITESSWTVLECLEHLNRYGDFYLPAIEKNIQKNASIKPEKYFISGLLGNYFAKSMWPKAHLNKMKTFKSMDPILAPLDFAVLPKFIEQQHQMLELLNNADTLNLSKVKTPISISKLIHLKLGDTFRVVIYHNERHIQQIKRILAALEL